MKMAISCGSTQYIGPQNKDTYAQRGWAKRRIFRLITLGYQDYLPDAERT